MIFSDEVVEQLLRPVHPSRVKRDPSGMSYLEQHDVRAHLNRIFGFGNWDQEVARLDLVFEQPTVIIPKGKDKPLPNRWDVCYSASVKLTVKGRSEGAVSYPIPCHYEDAATGYAQNQTRGEAHDLALKSAVSTALKRAGICLGISSGSRSMPGLLTVLCAGYLAGRIRKKRARKPMPDRNWYPAFREDWGHGNDHQTGWNKDWTVTMPDLLSPEGNALSRQYLAELQTMPLAPCEAMWGCGHPAGFQFHLHGCASLLICEYHANEWMQIVLEALNAYGGAFCDECRLIYPSLLSFMIWRFV